MKKLTVLLCLLYFAIGHSQEKKTSQISDIAIKSLKFKVNSSEELNTINWNDIKEIFSENKKDDEIELEFAIGFSNTKVQTGTNSSTLKIKGKSKDIDNLIKRAQKGLKVIYKIEKQLKKDQK